MQRNIKDKEEWLIQKELRESNIPVRAINNYQKQIRGIRLQKV